MLFEPLPIGSLTIPHRIIRSGTSEGGSDLDGWPNDGLKEMYVNLAKGGAALIVTGFAYVRADGRSGVDQNGIHRDDLIPRWREITEAVHAANPDTRIAMQIVHGGRQCKPESQRETIAPSAVYDPRADIMPREMTGDEVWELVEAFGQAARRVQEAGFDAVQLHAAHGYLLAQFNSPHTNRRTDEWGGSVEKRAKFFVEVYRRVRREVGKDFPILAKLNATDCLPAGLTPEESGMIGRILAEEGLDAIELSGWMYEAEPELTPSRKVHPAPEEEGYFRNEARVVRQAIPKATPVGLCGGIRSVAAMERLMAEDGYDFFAMSRPFIAEPDLARRLARGQPHVACDSCNECLETPRVPVVKCPPMLAGKLYERIGHPDWA